MTDEIKRELSQIPPSYTSDSLRQTFYKLLDTREREMLADQLTRFVRPLRMACDHMTEDEIARLLYETLSDCLCYDDSFYDADNGSLCFTYAGGIATGRAVCLGIAELYTLLGTALGLQVQTVIGYGGEPDQNGGLHAWNLLWLKDGDQVHPYHLDLTWDLAEHARIRGYRYYLKSDAFMQKHAHQWLKERYQPCPHNRRCTQIPRIPPAAKQRLCRQFEQMRRALALNQNQRS